MADTAGMPQEQTLRLQLRALAVSPGTSPQTDPADLPLCAPLELLPLHCPGTYLHVARSSCWLFWPTPQASGTL